MIEWQLSNGALIGRKDHFLIEIKQVNYYHYNGYDYEYIVSPEVPIIYNVRTGSWTFQVHGADEYYNLSFDSLQEALSHAEDLQLLTKEQKIIKDIIE